MNPEATAPVRYSRRRWALSALVVVAALMVPAILVPTALYLLREPAFKTLNELQDEQIASLKIFVLNRPDQLPDLGSTKQLMTIPEDGQARVLQFLRNAKPVEAGRSIFLGRLVVHLNSGQREQIILNRFGDPKAGYQLRYFIGQQAFDAGPVNEFTKILDELQPPAIK